MKRMLSVLAAALFLLCGCQSQDADAKEAFTLVLTNNGGSEIYGIHCEYCLEGAPAGGQMVSRNPEMDQPLPQGGELSFSFTERDLPADANLAEFGCEFFAVLKSGEELPIGEYSEFPVEYGQEYLLELSGDAESGFILKKGS